MKDKAFGRIVHSSSFRDPGGYLFKLDGVLYRHINLSYQQDYDLLVNSGLYQTLISKNLLVSHEELVPVDARHFPKSYKTIKPEFIDFISYPYEWSFGQLKDAALLTLKIQKLSLEKGMSLKDASAYNVQFLKGRPIMIDTLSFEGYREGEPWKAYKQFVQHFLAPLLLMSHTDLRLNKLAQIFLDGIPLDLASKLLPFKTKLQFGPYLHLHYHSKVQKKHERKHEKVKGRLSKKQLRNVVISLETLIKKLQPHDAPTEWGAYYGNTNYDEVAFASKQEIVSEFIDYVKPKSLWDLGANDGTFSRLASNKGIPCVSFDIDPVSVHLNYLKTKKDKEPNILPLVLDLKNPTPAIGWDNKERYSLYERAKPEMIIALALMHHLVFSDNITIEMLAKYFSSYCNYLLIEFIPKSDSKVKILLLNRESYIDYDLDIFVDTFELYFEIVQKATVINSDRILFLMKKLAK